MPYADREHLRVYQREWIARRRAAWLEANGPCVQCGSSDGLEVDHIDPATKVSHAVWSWSAVRREAELAKCQVLCRLCHRARTTAQQSKPAEHGTWQCYGRGCREVPCRRAWTAYKTDLRESRRSAA